MAFTKEKYRLLKSIAVRNYEKIGQIYCPYFHESVHFNSIGIEHILFRHRDNRRPERDQYPRLKVLYLAPAIISLSHTLQSYGVRIENNTMVRYYVFSALLNTRTTIVVVRQVGNGSKHFFSLMPDWRKNKFPRER